MFPLYYIILYLYTINKKHSYGNSYSNSKNGSHQ